MKNVTGSTRGWFLVIVALLLAGFVAWEANRYWNPKVPPPEPPEVTPGPPIARQAPPPVLTETKKTPPVISVPKKVPPVQRKSARPTPPPPRAIPKTPSPPPSPPPPVVLVPPPAPPEPQEWQGNDTAVTHAGQVVIHNDRQWIHFWSEHRPHEAAPEVDFTRNMVIGVFAGPRPADAFSIRILGMRAEPKTLVVDYRERLPPPGTFAVNVTVYPYHLKVVPQSTLPVKFNLLAPDNPAR